MDDLYNSPKKRKRKRRNKEPTESEVRDILRKSMATEDSLYRIYNNKNVKYSENLDKMILGKLNDVIISRGRPTLGCLFSYIMLKHASDCKRLINNGGECTCTPILLKPNAAERKAIRIFESNVRRDGICDPGDLPNCVELPIILKETK